MLIAKGYEVHFYVGGKKISPPASYGMLHDPSGESWPSDSVLVASFSKDRKEIEDASAESYFGDPPLGGGIDLPSRDLSRWTELGSVEKIEYTRMRPHGMPAQYEGDYYHFFDSSEGLLSILSFIFKGPEPVLYRRGRLYRMELPFFAQLGDEGYVWP
jgi:hypothetical protein